MQKTPLVFTAATIGALVIAGYLFHQLRTERKSALQQQERILQLELALQGARSSMDAPQVAGQSPPAIAPAIAKPATAQEAVTLTRSTPSRASSAEIGALPGREGSDQLQEMQRTARRSARIVELQTNLAATSFPLSDAQAAQLAPVLGDEQRRRAEDDKMRVRPADARELLDYNEESLKATEASYVRVVVAARTFLSPEQVAVLQTSLNKTVLQQRESLRVQRAQLDGGGSGNGATAPGSVITR